MTSDDATLVEHPDDAILRATHAPRGADGTWLRERLDAGEVRQRVLALRGLARRAEMTDELWRRVLGDGDVELRREALERLAHDPEDSSPVLDVVVALLGDDDALVVEAAAFALGEHLYEAAVGALCDVASGHDDARCRESAVAALGAIGDDRGRLTILAALQDKPAVRRRAVVALSNFEGTDVESALDLAADDRDWQVRSAVAQLRQPRD